jgi:tetratricopeptide (TPR) repeat protein
MNDAGCAGSFGLIRNRGIDEMTQDILPDDVRKERAKDLLSLRRLEEARELLSELCRDDQRDVEIWFLYSTANAGLERFEDVIAACRKALEIEPNYLPALNSLASAHAALGRHAEATEAFATVLRLAPDNPAVLNNYGHALALSGRTEEARRALENAVRIQPFYAEAHYNLAVLLDQIGMPAEALREYEQAATLKPELTHLLGERLDQLREVVRGRS